MSAAAREKRILLEERLATLREECTRLEVEIVRLRDEEREAAVRALDEEHAREARALPADKVIARYSKRLAARGTRVIWTRGPAKNVQCGVLKGDTVYVGNGFISGAPWFNVYDTPPSEWP